MLTPHSLPSSFSFTLCSSHPTEGRRWFGGTTSHWQNRGARVESIDTKRGRDAGKCPVNRRGDEGSGGQRWDLQEQLSTQEVGFWAESGVVHSKGLCKPSHWWEWERLIKFLGSSKKVICLSRGNTRDPFPVLETVSCTHHVFFPGLLTQSRAMPRDRPRKDLSRRQPPKHCSHGDETSQIFASPRGLFYRGTDTQGNDNQASDTYFCYFLKEVSGIWFWPGVSNFQRFRGAAAPAGENCSYKGTNRLKSDRQILIHRKTFKNTSEIVDFSFSPLLSTSQ